MSVDIDTNIILLFLDVDGVLNKSLSELDMMLDTDTVINTSHSAHPQLSLECLSYFVNLIQTIERIGTVRLVLSSSWRLDETLVEFLFATIESRFHLNLKSIFHGSISKVVRGSRSAQINEWLTQHYDTQDSRKLSAWVAIDDVENNLALIDNLHKVITYDSVGLSEQKALEVITKIKNQISNSASAKQPKLTDLSTNECVE